MTQNNAKRIPFQPLIYVWETHSAGYEWLSAKVCHAQKRDLSTEDLPAGDWVLTPSEPWILEQYRNPPSDLFLHFSQLGEDQESIRRFADRYGLLGFENVLLSRPGPGPTKVTAASGFDGHLVPGELLSNWRNEIVSMRQVVTLWRALLRAKSGDAEEVSKYIRWRAKDAIQYLVDGNEGLGGSWIVHQLNLERLRYIKRGDLIRPAEFYLCDQIQKRLACAISAQVIRSERADTLMRIFRPSGLLSLLWLQFADAVGEVTRFHVCQNLECGKLILIQPDKGRRSHRMTCSDVCRFRIYQLRKQRSLVLFKSGKNPAEIARELSAKIEIVHGWVARQLDSEGHSVDQIVCDLGIPASRVRRLLAVTHRTT